MNSQLVAELTDLLNKILDEEPVVDQLSEIIEDCMDFDLTTWQPMVTAPHDGRYIILVAKGRSTTVPAVGLCKWAGRAGCRWRWLRNDGKYYLMEPIGWIPMPLHDYIEAPPTGRVIKAYWDGFVVLVDGTTVWAPDRVLEFARGGGVIIKSNGASHNNRVTQVDRRVDKLRTLKKAIKHLKG